MRKAGEQLMGRRKLQSDAARNVHDDFFNPPIDSESAGQIDGPPGSSWQVQKTLVD
jgi:hypothetical protein